MFEQHLQSELLLASETVLAGTTFDDDDGGIVADNGNTTAGGNPDVTVRGRVEAITPTDVLEPQ